MNFFKSTLCVITATYTRAATRVIVLVMGISHSISMLFPSVARFHVTRLITIALFIYFNDYSARVWHVVKAQMELIKAARKSGALCCRKRKGELHDAGKQRKKVHVLVATKP